MPPAFEALLRDVGVVARRGAPAARLAGRSLRRELALVRDTVTDPSVERPLAILLAAVRPASGADRPPRDGRGAVAEGVAEGVAAGQGAPHAY